MSYQRAMEAAGAIVHDFESFGSYQGEWYAKVTFAGQTGFVSGWYGSCSGCDAFEGEFGYDRGEECDEHRYAYPKVTNCAACLLAKADYQIRLINFGLSYLDNIMTAEQAVKEASRHLDWDGEAQAMVDWIKRHA